jgi:hypothetical protein
METVLDTYQQVVHTNATITASGSSVVAMNFGHKETSLVINVTAAPTGTTPSITYSIQEVDPGNGTTTITAAKTGAAITALGVQILTLPVTYGGDIIVTWTVTGTTPSFTGVYATLVNKGPSPAIYDQAGNGPVAVKPASTAVTSTDPSIAVGLSPNSPLPAGTNALGSVSVTMLADRQVSGTLGALSASLTINTQGTNTLILDVSGTWVGTIQVQVSFDNGATYPGTISAFTPNTFYPGPGGLTANGIYYVGVGGTTNVKLVMGAYLSGTATVEMNAAAGSQYTKLLSYVTDGSNVAAVKAASTAAVATDPSLVVTESPNSPGATSALQTSGNTLLSTIATNTGAAATDFIVTGTITTAGSAGATGYVEVTGQGVYTVTVSITGTWAGTLIAQGQLGDNTWVQLPMYLFSAGSANLPYLAQASTTANGTFILTGGGYQNIRIYASTYTSGTVNVGLEGSLAQQTIFAAQLGQWNMSGSAISASGNIAANGNVISLPSAGIASIQGYAGMTFEVYGTWSGVLTLQGSNDGTNYNPVAMLNLGTPNAGPQGTVTANGLYYAPIGYLYFNLVMSGYVSGTVDVVASLHAVPPALVPSFPTNTVAGTPALLVENSENTRATYSIGVSNFAIASGATDVTILNGSATKTVRVTRILFSMTTTTAAVVPVIIIKRSTANAGGTTGIAAITPHDSNNAAATAGNLFYAANATTLGTTVGTMIRAAKYFSEVATPTSPAEVLEWTFGQNGEQPPTLRGTAQGLAINLNGTTIAGATMTCIITWTEDSN